jgi:hypothetical protein
VCIDKLGFTWDMRYGELIKYKEQFEDCNVPFGWPENKQLSFWVHNQRINYRNGKLSEDHIKRLEDIVFVWDTLESNWEEMFDVLKEYKENHGDCNVPINWSENKQLSSWVANQRINYRNGKLSDDRIKRLEDIGFVWERFESKWEEQFAALKEYKKNHGDCNVPNSWSENKQLADWVRGQRTSYREGKLSEDRIKRLEDMGFVWKLITYIPSKASWDEMFDALNEYKKNHGDCNVPHRWPENKQLSTWVHTQRTNYRRGNLSDDRIKRLEDIGFVWKRISYIPSKASWEEMFDLLKEYKENHGDCNVPGDWPENKQLSSWVANQRTNYKNKTLSDDRIKLLEDIGFVWDVPELSWEKMFEALKEYKRNHGDFNVPLDYVVNNLKLRIWVYNQRVNYRKGKLSRDRTKRLNDIVFVWDTLESQWEEMFNALKEYKKEHGDYNVPNDYVVNYLKLGSWVSHQRTNYRRGNLAEDRIKRLEDIGFVWTSHFLKMKDQELWEAMWKKKFDTLKEYKNKHGDCNVPVDWPDRQLVNWVASQRTRYRNKRLNEERIERLEDIGFEWNIRK